MLHPMFFALCCICVMFTQVTQTLQKDLLHMDSLACLLADVTLHRPLQMDSENSDTFQQQQNGWAFCKTWFMTQS